MKFSESLKKNKDFQNVYKNGKSLANSCLVMYVKENGLGKNRVGISVSKKSPDKVDQRRLQTVRRIFPVWNRYDCDSKDKCKGKKLS